MEMEIPVPHFSDSDSDEKPQTPISKEGIPNLSCDELANMIQNPESYNYDRIFILDVRFDYEYNKSHINGARSVINQKQMVKIFYLCRYRNACVICYCNESQKKSKAVFKKIRIFDRKNTPYPELTIRNLYVLDGGYNTFHKNYPQLCVNNEVAQNT